MANISAFLNKIAKAIYGKDVRSAIHDALNAVNSESSTNSTDIITLKSNVNTNANNIIAVNTKVTNLQNNKVDKTQYASTTIAGVIKLATDSTGANKSGISVFEDGTAAVYADSNFGTQRTGGRVGVYAATEDDIDQQTHQYRPIVPAKLKYAVESIVGNQTTLGTNAKKIADAINELILNQRIVFLGQTKIDFIGYASNRERMCISSDENFKLLADNGYATFIFTTPEKLDGATEGKTVLELYPGTISLIDGKSYAPIQISGYSGLSPNTMYIAKLTNELPLYTMNTSDNSYTHANAELLGEIPIEKIIPSIDINTDTQTGHTHENKDILDLIDWRRFSEFSDNVGCLNNYRITYDSINGIAEITNLDSDYIPEGVYLFIPETDLSTVKIVPTDAFEDDLGFEGDVKLYVDYVYLLRLSDVDNAVGTVSILAEIPISIVDVSPSGGLSKSLDNQLSIKTRASYGLSVGTNGLYIKAASTAEVQAKTNGFNPLVPSQIDNSVRASVLGQYSITPVQVGNWIDGTPIWRIAFPYTSMSKSDVCVTNADSCNIHISLENLIRNYVGTVDTTYLINQNIIAYSEYPTWQVSPDKIEGGTIYFAYNSEIKYEDLITYDNGYWGGYIEFATPADNIVSTAEV